MMKMLLFCCCIMCVVGGATALVKPRLSAQAFTNSTSMDNPGFRTFKPSEIRKQKRKLKQHFSGWGWGVLGLTALIIGGLIWLAVWLWPMSALGWRIIIAGLGISLIAVIAFMGFYLFSFSYNTNRDLRSEARNRLHELAEKIPFEIAQDWCFPGEGFRLTIAANSGNLLVLDYQQDRGWMIPQQNIGAVHAELIALEAVSNTYPPTAQAETIVNMPDQPSPSKDNPELPLQVLRFELRDLPLTQITLAYREQIFSDSAQQVAVELRNLWGRK